MKTYLLDIIPKIQRFSKKLDNTTLLVDKEWVLIDEELDRKIVYIFKLTGHQLLIADNGKVEKGLWEYIGTNSLLIDRVGGSYLFKHGFVDDNVLALKLDSRNENNTEFALFVNEEKFYKLYSIPTILYYLKSTYQNGRTGLEITIPEVKKITTELDGNNEFVPSDNFLPSNYPSLEIEIEHILKTKDSLNHEYAADIIISFCRYHSLKAELLNRNPVFSDKVLNKTIKTEAIEKLLDINRDNQKFIDDFEAYIRLQFGAANHK